MATAFADVERELDPLDVTRPELFSEDRWQEPFRELRATAPIRKSYSPKFGEYWSVSTYKPIQYVEALPKIFSSSWEVGGITVAGDGIEHLKEYEMPMPMFIAMDPPQHNAQRRTVAPAFGPSEIIRMRDDAIKRTGEVLDSLPIGKPFDWVDLVSIDDPDAGHSFRFSLGKTP
jgi:cytochrome P450